MKTHILFWFIAPVAVSFLTGCGKREAGVDSAQRGAAPTGWKGLSEAAKPYRGAIIRILGEDLPPLHSLERLREQFSNESGIRVEIDFKNHSKVIQSILQGALSKEYRYDVIFVPHKELGRLVATSSLWPLDRFAALRDPAFKPEEQCFEPFFDEVSKYRGVWYGIPLYLGGSIVVYRKDLLDSIEAKERFAKQFGGAELTEPSNPDEWLRLAQFFHRPAASPPLYGCTLLLSDESLWYEWQSALFAFRGNVLDIKHGWEYGDIVVNSPQAVKATEFYLKMSDYCPPDASSYSWGLGIAKQQAGVSFMTLLQYDVVAEFENPAKTRLAGNFGYFLPPTTDGQRASQLESWVGFIPVSAKHPEAAWLLLQWMMGERIQLAMHLEGNISPRKSTYEDPRVKAMRPTPTILQSVTCMVPKPTFPEASAIQDILTRHLQAVFRRQKAPQQALDAAALEIEQRLKGRVKMAYPVK